jgi:hypothetical protein
MKTLSIDEALETQFTIEQWLEYFRGLTRAEFFALFRAATDHLADAIRTHDTRWISSFSYALASKVLEFGHFEATLSEEQRLNLIEVAEQLWKLTHTWLSGFPEWQQAFSKAWSIDQERCTVFGYSSPANYAVLAPHRIFEET